MSEIDQQFIEYVVKSLVGKPDAVKIDRRVDEKGVLLELTVDPEDLGRVIGKRGATAQSLRTLLRALGTKNEARYNLKIIDNGPLDHAKPADDSQAPAAAVPKDEPAATPKDDKPAEEIAAVETTVEESAPEEAPAPEPEEEPAAVETEEEEDKPSDRLTKTRAELADLDDLDI